MSNVDLTTGFFAAVARSELAVIQHLYSTRGVGINIRDHVGRTPLHLAILSASFDVIQYLFSEGADLRLRMKKGETVVHLAVMRGSLGILRLVMDTLRERQIKDGVHHLELEETPNEMEIIKVPVHVDSTMSSPKVSPLHLAVMYGE
jgi:hypothetical protein